MPRQPPGHSEDDPAGGGGQRPGDCQVEFTINAALGVDLCHKRYPRQQGGEAAHPSCAECIQESTERYPKP